MIQTLKDMNIFFLQKNHRMQKTHEKAAGEKYIVPLRNKQLILSDFLIATTNSSLS
jgi:hypothetical protein